MLLRKKTQFIIALALFLPLWGHTGNETPAPPAQIKFDEVLAAMGQIHGYNIQATTNAARFHAQVLLRLARQLRERDPKISSFAIRQEDWFRAYLQTAGIDAAHAPVFAALANEYGQDYVVEFGEGRVASEIIRGPAPLMALDVSYSWASRPNPAEHYSYDDNLSTPRLKVTNARRIHYRLLDYGEWIYFDEIEGLTGRPTSGALGLIFRIIGEGRVVEFRFASAPDGTAVAKARSRKFGLEVGATATVQPDGKSEKGVPPDPTLQALEKKLETKVDVRYKAKL